MKLTILFIFLLYYGMLSLFFNYASPYMSEGFNNTIVMGSVNINETGIPEAPSTVGIGDFFAFLGFGIGLPDDTPSWFQFIFSAWQTIMLFLFAGFLYQAIRGS
jgi:hypothetical protein